MEEEGNVNALFHSSAVLLMLDSPPGLHFGIDNITWKIGTKFKGVKMIPLGVHIITYALKEEDNMFKISQFIAFGPENEKRIRVYRWNYEYMYFVELSGQEAQGYRQGVKNYHFDSYLGPYPEENIDFWKKNTHFITKPVLGKLDPINRMKKFNQEYSDQQPQLNPAVAMVIDEEPQNQEEDTEPEPEPVNQKSKVGRFWDLIDTIYYSSIPRKLKQEPTHINSVNIDRTEILQDIISKQWQNQPLLILGELQYAFIHFLIGEENSSLDQWKKLINLLAFSEKAYQKGSSKELQALVLEFIVVLYQQLQQFPNDFFHDSISKGSFLEDCLRRLKSYQVEEPDIPNKVKSRLQKLFHMIEHKFHYSLLNQDLVGSDQEPVIVDTQQICF